MSQISRKATEFLANEKVQFRQEYFFKFLQISHSYRLAHRKISLKETIPKKDLPSDFELVMKVYKKVGDVFNSTFDSWWAERGKNLFIDNRKSTQIWLTLDLSRSKVELLEDYGLLIDRLKSKSNLPNNEKIQLLANKIRLKSLSQRYLLVVNRADFLSNKTSKDKLWALGKSIGIGSKWTKHIRLDSKRSLTNAPVRSYLSILVSKNLKDAKILAENAARGFFPSLDPLATALDFDYESIKRINQYQTHKLWESVMAARHDKKKYMALLDPSKSFVKSKSMDVGVDLEVDFEAQIQQKLKASLSTKKSITEYEMLLEAEEALLKLKVRRK